MGVVSMIASANYVVVNKQLARTFGLDEALLLGELASELEYWQKRGELQGGYFYSTIDNVKESTTLSDKRQRAALHTLKEAGVLDVKLAGLPAKRYIRLDEAKLAALLLQDKSSQNGETSSAETAKLDTPKRQTNNNKDNNNKNNNNKEIYSSVIDYLNSKAGTHYRATSKATQQHINARLSEGYTVEDFQRVIDNKCAEWLGGDFEQYLRPQTLFGTKFENYLNAKRQAKGANGIAVSSSPSDLQGVF